LRTPGVVILRAKNGNPKTVTAVTTA